MQRVHIAMISSFIVTNFKLKQNNKNYLTETQKSWFAGILRWISRCTVGRQHIWTFLFNRLTYAQARSYSNSLFF